MAVRAVAAHLILMGFVLSVAVRTIRFSFPVFRPIVMAVLTVGLSVCAQKLEVGEAVIKSALIQQHDDGVAALVFGVAGSTLIGLNLGTSTVKTRLLGNVQCDVFVAVKAELLLSRFVEHFVARRTFALILGMYGDHFPGHNQRLNILSSRSL